MRLFGVTGLARRAWRYSWDREGENSGGDGRLIRIYVAQRTTALTSPYERRVGGDDGLVVSLSCM